MSGRNSRRIGYPFWIIRECPWFKSWIILITLSCGTWLCLNLILFFKAKIALNRNHTGVDQPLDLSSLDLSSRKKILARTQAMQAIVSLFWYLPSLFSSARCCCNPYLIWSAQAQFAATTTCYQYIKMSQEDNHEFFNHSQVTPGEPRTPRRNCCVKVTFLGQLSRMHELPNACYACKAYTWPLRTQAPFKKIGLFLHTHILSTPSYYPKLITSTHHKSFLQDKIVKVTLRSTHFVFINFVNSITYIGHDGSGCV